MIADREDVARTLKEKHARAQTSMLPVARVLAGAAPVMDKLTRSEEWNRYCTYLEGMARQFSERKAVAQAKLGDPSIVKDEDVRKLRQDIFEADVWMNAMRFCIELPAAIIKGGEEADKFISQLREKNETPTA